MRLDMMTFHYKMKPFFKKVSDEPYSVFVKNFDKLYEEIDSLDSPNQLIKIVSSALDKSGAVFDYDKMSSLVRGMVSESNLRKSIIKENMSLDSDYLQRQLKILADDMKRDEPEVAKAYLFIQHRINQSFPDGDVSREDVEDLLHEPQGRKHLKNMPEWAIDQLFESRKQNRKLRIIENYIRKIVRKTMREARDPQMERKNR